MEEVRGGKILLVDDDPFIRVGIMKELEAEGYEVVTASTGEEVFEKDLLVGVSCVVTDLVMEDIDGIGILRRIREADYRIGVIILTGYGDMNSAIEALRCGADDYLLKPVRTAELLLRIGNCIEKCSLRRERDALEKRVRERTREIEEVNRALKESEARYRFIFDNVGVALWEEDVSEAVVCLDSLTREGVSELSSFLDEHPEVLQDVLRKIRILDMNKAAVNLLEGEKKEQFLGGLLALVKPDTYRYMKEEVIALSERKRSFVFEICGESLKGRKIDQIISCSIPGEGEDYTYMLVSIMDVTHLKEIEKSLVRTLKEKDILIREIHHRVKNNLAMIASLINLQLGKIEDPESKEGFKSLRKRIQSIYLVHERLYKSGDFVRLDIRTYLADLVQNIKESFDFGECSIVCDIDEIHLDIDTMIPLGLIVNELVNNSLKHGFSETRSEYIRVSARNEGTRALLIVEDNGKGLPKGFTIDGSVSLGLLLVRSLTEQINGTLSIEEGESLRFLIRFPLL